MPTALPTLRVTAPLTPVTFSGAPATPSRSTLTRTNEREARAIEIVQLRQAELKKDLICDGKAFHEWRETAGNLAQSHDLGEALP